MKTLQIVKVGLFLFVSGFLSFCLAGTINTSNGGGAAVPQNTIVMTIQSACPNGYSEYTAARGYFLVGVPSGGTITGTVGTALTDQQNLTHSHNISSTTAANASVIGAGVYVSNLTAQTTVSSTSAVSPYFQIRLCQKI